MVIQQIIDYLESIAPSSYQENYDNAGLITGLAGWECTGALICLDTTEAVVTEAIQKNCNLVIAHHPIIFSGLKKINGKNYVEQTVITAIKNDIAIYAIHTNLDNVQHGVNGKIADRLGLVNCSVLQPKTGTLKKLFTFVPLAQAELVRSAIFMAGGGAVGNYSECSFNVEGEGSFKAGEETNPYVGEIGRRHTEKEIKLEVIFPAYLENKIVKAMIGAHPYEEVAYDIIQLNNNHPSLGAGIIGDLTEPVDETVFLRLLKDRFKVPVIKHTLLTGKQVKRIACCGGAGSFLIVNALTKGADFFITSDLKYHEFFDANNRLVIADIGHYESEQFTIDLLYEILKGKFSSFALLKTEVNTNPVNYFID
ncbi:MAG: Nif3-like dinuclear metal center hexameric protein [Chitinophagaceae bacterium]